MLLVEKGWKELRKGQVTESCWADELQTRMTSFRGNPHGLHCLSNKASFLADLLNIQMTRACHGFRVARELFAQRLPRLYSG